jgi:predicted O-methyltransferase YrrM
MARRYWDEAGVADRIDLHVAPASQTLDRMLMDGEEGSYDFAFVDADKAGYDGYYERLLRLVRPGGLIALDNTLWSGAVLDEDATDDDTVALRALNVKLAADERITVCLLPIADGVTLARRR